MVGNSTLQNSFDGEYDLIQATPHASREEVEAYHAPIIERLDKNKFFQVPGFAHKKLHQIIWMKGYSIYNPCPNERISHLCFTAGERCPKALSGECIVEGYLRYDGPKAEGASSRYSSEREHFDCWYANRKIQDSCGEWENCARADAENTARRVSGLPLSEMRI